MKKQARTFKEVLAKYAQFHINPDQFEVAKTKSVPSHIKRPLWLTDPVPKFSYYDSLLLRKDPIEIKSMRFLLDFRKAGQIAAGALEKISKEVKIGMTGEEADEIIHDYIVSQGAYPSGVGFMGFPKSVCISTNDILCHGIPNSRKFQEGDWVNFDVTCFYEGFFGDTSIMIKFGKVDEDVSKMVLLMITKIDVCQMALYNAIKICKPGNSIADVARAIQ